MSSSGVERRLKGSNVHATNVAARGGHRASGREASLHGVHREQRSIQVSRTCLPLQSYCWARRPREMG